MGLVFSLLVGIAIELTVGDSCEQALHRLRNEEKLHIEATNTLHRSGAEDVLVYTMTKGKQKTAIIGCALREPD